MADSNVTGRRLQPAAINSYDFSDVDEVPTALTGVDARMWLAAQPCTRRWSLVNAQLHQSDLMYGSMAGPFCSAAAAHERSVLVALKLDRGASWSLNGHPFAEREIMVVRPGGEYALRTREAGDWAVIRLDADQFEQYVNTMSPCGFTPVLASVRVLRPAASTLNRFRQVIRSVRAASVSGADERAMRTLARSLHDNALRAVVCASETHGRTPRPDNARLVRLAVRYLDDHHHEPVYLADLCSATGSSERSLRRAFQAIYGMSPIGFLRIHRLNQARRALVTGMCTSVTEAAMLCGFFDLGRFAGAYRNLFGELPSAALR